MKMPKVKEILKRIKKLEIKTNRLVEGLISGEYHSVFKGMGIEFSDVREYAPGDDIRTIDWNVTARYNSPFVKEFILPNCVLLGYKNSIVDTNDDSKMSMRYQDLDNYEDGKITDEEFRRLRIEWHASKDKGA